MLEVGVIWKDLQPEFIHHPQHKSRLSRINLEERVVLWPVGRKEGKKGHDLEVEMPQEVCHDQAAVEKEFSRNCNDNCKPVVETRGPLSPIIGFLFVCSICHIQSIHPLPVLSSLVHLNFISLWFRGWIGPRIRLSVGEGKNNEHVYEHELCLEEKKLEIWKRNLKWWWRN